MQTPEVWLLDGRLPKHGLSFAYRGYRLHLPTEELLVPEQPPNPAQPTESTLVLGFLREDVQDICQDMRQIHERIDQTNERIDDLAKQLDSRYAQLMAMLIACTSILVTTNGGSGRRTQVNLLKRHQCLSACPRLDGGF